MYDTVIIGTGLYGIQAARYYLDIHLDSRLLLLESDDVVGGTWSSKRIYEDFWTQTPVRMAEFSDRPMTPPPEQYYGFFPGKYTTAYLESYVDDHTYSGQTIRDRISFNSYVESITKIQAADTADGANWEITYNGNQKVRTAKLIDATGMTSQPQIPTLPGSSDFKGRTLHHKSFGQS
ncbi:MAG: hypothetical protein L6R42_001415 [Xanthoria sp. 1 TBL-2021]|nr:MAG: hypothetical protein L6R42_001415 [Xanthoria sp. 1 TBL-2021]